MTTGERMVWAAAFACAMRGQWDRKNSLGIKEYPAGAVEEAWAAVEAMREAMPDVTEGWGEDSEQAAMLKEMMS